MLASVSLVKALEWRLERHGARSVGLCIDRAGGNSIVPTPLHSSSWCFGFAPKKILFAYRDRHTAQSGRCRGCGRWRSVRSTVESRIESLRPLFFCGTNELPIFIKWERIRTKYGGLPHQAAGVHLSDGQGGFDRDRGEFLRAGGVPVQHLHSIGGDLTDQFRLRRSGRSLTARGRRKIEGMLQGILLKIPESPLESHYPGSRSPRTVEISRRFFQVLRKILWDNPQFDSRSDEGDCHLLIDAFNRQMLHELCQRFGSTGRFAIVWASTFFSTPLIANADSG